MKVANAAFHSNSHEKISPRKHGSRYADFHSNAMTTRRIIGIDPGSRITGIGIIDTDGRRTQHVMADCLRLGDKPLPERLGRIFNEISDFIRQYQPNEMAIENVFVSNNAASALKLGQARGAAICAGVVAGLPVSEYSPKEIKQATVGKGAADKTQVQHMVKVLLNLQGKLQVDSADALAVALCHAHISHLNSRIAGAAATQYKTSGRTRRR